MMVPYHRQEGSRRCPAAYVQLDNARPTETRLGEAERQEGRKPFHGRGMRAMSSVEYEVRLVSQVPPFQERLPTVVCAASPRKLLAASRCPYYTLKGGF